MWASLAAVAFLCMKDYLASQTLGSFFESSPTAGVPKSQRPKGVFVIKVARAEDAGKTLCSLTHFFNAKAQYPVRIFADIEDKANATGLLQEHFSGGADVQVIVDTEKKWAQFPPMLEKNAKAEALQHCTNMETPEHAKCTTLNVPLGYAHMVFWRYMRMANEPSLRDFDYFVTLDADAFLTEPIPDPFELMAQNNLTGIFNIEAFESGDIAKGIQKSVEEVFSIEERRSKYLDNPETIFFDEQGVWSDGYGVKPSIWACFYGGRLDFFRSRRYNDFARRIVPYTYIYRTAEQPVVGAAWALLADNDKIWYLPKRGIHLGIYHHGWIDNREAMLVENTTNNSYWFHTLDHWSTFKENYDRLISWEDYLDTKGEKDWDKCESAPDKGAILPILDTK